MEYRSLQAVAYERLRDMIQDGALEFDAIYSETRLAAEFAISRTPMRDALTRLQNERYIDILPNRGFKLHRPLQEDIIEAYHMRTAIECHCAALIAREKDSDRARAAIERMKEAAARQRQLRADADMNLKDFWNQDVQFHLALAEYPGVPAFRRQFDCYMHFFAAHYVRAYRSRGRDLSTLDEHGAIIAALEAGDEAGARSAAERHMAETLEMTLRNME